MARGDGGEGWERRGLLALHVAFVVGAAAALAWQVVDPRPASAGGVTVDRLGAALAFLVATVGATAYRFSVRHLEGEPGRPRFLRWLTFTVAAAFLLMLATNLVLLFLAWTLTSVGLHQLLTHYADRPEAVRPARKKFLISRLGDLALVAAVVVVWRGWGTLELDALNAAVAGDPAGGPVGVVALLVALAALTKSAQFPFHSWLPETMESPTPVSALMHAGVINAGGALLVKFAPVLVRVPEALFLLALVGTVTATLGLLAMWAQVKVKRTLAWSTVSQMGFMMIQCGLAAFPAAVLHLVGHGWYKAWAFLRAGDLPAPAPRRPVGVGRALVLLAVGTALGVAAVAAAAASPGFDPAHSPGELALAALVALACGQVWVGLLGRKIDLVPVAATIFATALLPRVAFALYAGAAAYLAPVLGDLPAPAGPLAWAAAALPVVALAGLAVLHACLPALARTAAGRALYVHALHGWYFGAIADRVVDRLWDGRHPTMKEVARA